MKFLHWIVMALLCRSCVLRELSCSSIDGYNVMVLWTVHCRVHRSCVSFLLQLLHGWRGEKWWFCGAMTDVRISRSDITERHTWSLPSRKPGGVIADRRFWYDYSFLRKPCHRQHGAEGYHTLHYCITQLHLLSLKLTYYPQSKKNTTTPKWSSPLPL